MDWVLDGTDTSFFEAFEVLGHPWLVFPGTLLLAALTFYWNRWVSLTIVGTMVFAVIVTAVTKSVVERPRPPAAAELDGWAFPSQTTVQAGVFLGLVTVVVWYFGAPRLVTHLVLETAIVLTLLTGIGRVVSGTHWPSDIVGSAIVIAVAMALAGMFVEANQRTTPLIHRPQPAQA